MSITKDKAKLLTLLAEIYGDNFTPSRLKAYLTVLEDLSLQEIKFAFEHFTKDSDTNRMPLPAAIRKVARPQLSTKQQAIRIIDHIEAAIKKFGYHSAQEAKEKLGPQCWDVVSRLGGWTTICQRDRLNTDAGYAQARDQVEAFVTSQRQGLNYEALPGAETPRQLENKNNIHQLVQDTCKGI